MYLARELNFREQEGKAILYSGSFDGFFSDKNDKAPALSHIQDEINIHTVITKDVVREYMPLEREGKRKEKRKTIRNNLMKDIKKVFEDSGAFHVTTKTFEQNEEIIIEEIHLRTICDYDEKNSMDFKTLKKKNHQALIEDETDLSAPYIHPSFKNIRY